MFIEYEKNQNKNRVNNLVIVTSLTSLGIKNYNTNLTKIKYTLGVCH